MYSSSSPPSLLCSSSSSSSSASNRSSSNLSVINRSITAVASGPNPCTLAMAPFKDDAFSPPTPPPPPLLPTRFNNCNLIKLRATTSATSASHPSMSAWRIHAADAPSAATDPALLSPSLIVAEELGRPFPPANSKLMTSSSNGIKSIGKDSNECTTALLFEAPNERSVSSIIPNSERYARSNSVMRGTKMNRNAFCSGCCCACGECCAGYCFC
mmetsp:Transcript_42416/g.89057  ORF Transcript_42416/g.89057 Transcript_42416/m.89057 type:complete len:214 (-) Transcript_42416:812-1453(-)